MGIKRILIVEDELITAMSLRLELSNCGYNIIDIVTTGANAITVSIDKIPDLILMDIFLADDINGIEAVKEIHKSFKIPVIYLTASDDPGTYELARRTDLAGFINKPYIFSKLKRTIEAVFNK